MDLLIKYDRKKNLMEYFVNLLGFTTFKVLLFKTVLKLIFYFLKIWKNQTIFTLFSKIRVINRV